MSIFRRHLSRRTLLRGLGAVIGLPVLDAMTPAFAGRIAFTRGARRLVFVYVPNGITMEAWTPKTQGSQFECSRILNPLEPFRDHLIVLSGLAQRNGEALGDGAGDHARAAASFLTGVHPRKTSAANVSNGVSVDQLVANHVATTTRFPSLEFGCDDPRTLGSCDSGYSCAYTNSLAWRSATTPLPPETNPRVIFERLFGDVDPTLSSDSRARRLINRRSVLDLVTGSAADLRRTLGPADLVKLDEYLSSIREVERRIEQSETAAEQVQVAMEKPTGVPPLFADYAQLMLALQVVALQADLTRVTTMMMGKEASMRTYPEIGIEDAHHVLTHHRGNREWIEKVTRVNEMHVRLFAGFIEKLHASPDGEGTLLDHSIVVYGSGLSDGDRHLHKDLPVLLLGGGGGFRGGRHLVYPSGTPMTNLYLSLLDRMGVPIERFGDSTGKIEHLTEI